MSDEAIVSIKKHSSASTGFLNLGVSIYDISQRVNEIYKTTKAKYMADEQRSVINLSSRHTVDEGKLNYTYNKTFKNLSEEVAGTNYPNVEKIDDLEIGKFELKNSKTI